MIELVDESGNISEFDNLTVDKENNTAIASLILPSLRSATAQGTNYTVRTKAYGYIEKTNVATFNISAPAALTGLSLSTSSFLLDEASGKTTEVTVYGDPSFTDFTIPVAGTGKAGNYVTALVSGKDFFNPRYGSISTNFTVSCDDATCGSAIVNGAQVTILNNKSLQVTLCIPGTAGEYKVSIKCSKNSMESTFTVKEYSTYAVGDIILTDKSKVDAVNVESYSASENNAAAGICLLLRNCIKFTRIKIQSIQVYQRLAKVNFRQPIIGAVHNRLI